MFEIGNTLREARLRRGLDILDCEAETKIRAKYLRAMEEEQFDLMPSPTYVRGFLRTYADFLDLDGRLVLDEYESRFGAYSLSQEAGARSARPPRSDSGPTRRTPEPPRRGAPAQAAPHRAPAPLARHRRRDGRRAPHLAGRRRVRHAHAGAADRHDHGGHRLRAGRRRARHGLHRGARSAPRRPRSSWRAPASTAAGSRCAARTRRAGSSSSRSSRRARARPSGSPRASGSTRATRPSSW